MRLTTFVVIATLSLPALAESQARPRPKDTQVVEDIASPPQVKDAPLTDRQNSKAQVKDGKQKVEPTVTTRKEGEVTISEYRVRGRLFQQKVQPASGPAYYLVDEKGEGKFTRVDGPDLKTSVPMWVLFEW